MIAKKHMKWGLALLMSSLLWTVPAYAVPAEGENEETEIQVIYAEETADASQDAEADAYSFSGIAEGEEEKASAAGSRSALQLAREQVVVDAATAPREEGAYDSDPANDCDAATAPLEEKAADSDTASEFDAATEEEERVEPAEAEDEASTPSENNETIGQRISAFALQFVGNPYVYGGSSLTRGTDCSGFVMSVYQNFGISLPHSSRSQRSIGADVGGIQNAIPGDIVCYSGHVGLYIGDGQIVHALNKRKGIVVSSAGFDRILAVRRVI